MQTVSVKVKGDHLQTVAKVRSPITAIAEMIWNGLDADANRISVKIPRNALGAPEQVNVRDDGHGIAYEEAITAFESLGGSWKKSSRKTRGQGRLLHGQEGKGRFKAFGISTTVQWLTRYSKNGSIVEYSISGSSASLDKFEIGDPVTLKNGARPGTEVTIYLDKKYDSLIEEKARQDLTEQLAIYLLQYPNVEIDYDGERLDPKAMTHRIEHLPLGNIKVEEGKEVTAELTVIEWNRTSDRALYLCDENGFTLAHVVPGIQAPGFNFTGYLKSAYIRQLDADGLLDFEEIHPGLNNLLEAARKKMREYFRQRTSEQTAEVVAQWKKDRIYPYEGDPQGVIETAERQVFDVVALSVHSYLPDFESSDNKSKSFSLKLLKQALENDPSSLQLILQDVLDLPSDKQKELADLLQRTTLSAIINASKVVGDRLNFVTGLELLVFESESKKTLLERRGLHRILANETWIFGEQFNISVDDQSLNEALKKHLSILGREELAPEPVQIEGQDSGILDLMLSRSIPTHHANEREHLVIELKRPSQKVDDEVEAQIMRYATAVTNDERFRDVKTRWDFWAISNELSDTVRKKAHQRNRPEGLLYEDAEAQIYVWAKTWGQIVQEAKTRLDFVQQYLKFKADSASALDYLRQTHSKYLPQAMQTNQSES